jgi:hypothetical protein
MLFYATAPILPGNGGAGGQEARKGPASPSQRFPRPECEPEKVEQLVRKVASTVRILAVRITSASHGLETTPLGPVCG